MKKINKEKILRETDKNCKAQLVEKINSLILYPCRKYYAFLTQTGSNAPVATVFVNELGCDITYTRDAQGTYTGTASKAVFTTNKCFIRWSGNEYNVSALNNIMTVFGSDFNDSTSFFISVGTVDANGSRDVADGELHHMIEIFCFN